MKAMILAAGYGTRLKPYTDFKPKALIEINGVPMLELLITKLIKCGITDIVINVHHFSEMIIDFIISKKHFGINIQFSKESHILGTGGGIKNAARFFDDDVPFLVHNVDILTDFDLLYLYNYHLQKNQLVTLAVMNRDTDRYFVVDQDYLICGHIDQKNNKERIIRQPNGRTKVLAFSGIHVISPKIFPLISEQGFFSIVDTYLRLIALEKRIGVYLMDKFYWKDIGRIDVLKQAEVDMKNGLI